MANSGFVVCSRADISAKPALAGAFGLADARRGGYDGRAAEFATSVTVVGVDGPPTASMCQNEVVESDLRQRRPSVDQISRIGMDTSKHIFQLHGVNAAEVPVLRKKLRRKEMIAFFEKLAPTVIGIEACGASHHWARLLQSFGHSVKLDNGKDSFHEFTQEPSHPGATAATELAAQRAAARVAC